VKYLPIKQVQVVLTELSKIISLFKIGDFAVFVDLKGNKIAFMNFEKTFLK